MKTAKFCLISLLAACGGLALAQTNTPVKTASEQTVDIYSKSSYFDGLSNKLVYFGHVFITDHTRAHLWCEQFTVDVPPDGGHPTNIVAETNVVVDVLDGQGRTNYHVTAAEAIYTYQLLNPMTNVVNFITNVAYSKTNEIITFTNGNPTVENSQMVATGEVLTLDVPALKFSGASRTTYKPHPSSGTNASPFNFLNHQ